MRKTQGIAIVVILLVLSLMAVVAVGLTQLGIGTLAFSSRSTQAEQAYYAAEAGLSHALVELKKNPAAFPAGFPANDPATLTVGASPLTYTVNTTVGPGVAPNGVNVPNEATYLLATGRTPAGVSRQAAVMVKASGSAFNYAAFTIEKTTLKNEAEIGVYDSAVGAASINHASLANRAHVGSNYNGADAIKLENLNTVRGTGKVLSYAPPLALNVGPGSTLDGTGTFPSPQDLPPVELPGDPGSGPEIPYDTSLGADLVVDDLADLSSPPFLPAPSPPGVLPPGNYKTLDIQIDAPIFLQDSGPYAFDNVYLKSSNASLDYLPVDPLDPKPAKVFVTNAFELIDGSLVNPTARPGLMNYFVRNGPVTIKDKKALAFYTVYAPGADTVLDKHCRLFGAVVAKNLTLDHQARIYYDVQLENQTMSGASVLLILSRDRL